MITRDRFSFVRGGADYTLTTMITAILSPQIGITLSLVRRFHILNRPQHSNERCRYRYRYLGTRNFRHTTGSCDRHRHKYSTSTMEEMVEYNSLQSAPDLDFLPRQTNTTANRQPTKGDYLPLPIPPERPDTTMT